MDELLTRRRPVETPYDEPDLTVDPNSPFVRDASNK